METNINRTFLGLANVIKLTVLVLGIFAVSTLGFSSNPGVANATSGVEKIYAKSLLNYECDAKEWHFIINGITGGVVAPTVINAVWSDGIEELTLDKVTGHAAHYLTSNHLDATIVSAEAYINTGWDGQFNVSHGPKSTCIDDTPEPLGSISVCKAIVDDEGVVVDGSANAGSFEISGVDFNNPAGVIETSSFQTSLTFNKDVFSNVAGDDVQCVTYGDLGLGNYYYGEEVVTGDNWLAPKYNDQHTSTVDDLTDFYTYSGELFTIDTSDDSSRNTNSDGHIVLSEGRPDRTLIVLNTYEIEPAPFCGDGIVNQTWEQCDGGNQCTQECTIIELPDNACPFDQIEGRIIIDFADGDKIRSDNGDNSSGPVGTSVPEGTYKVSLASYDGYENRSNSNQPEEIWKLLLNKGDTLMAHSNRSTDLADDVDYAARIDEVNAELYVPHAIDNAVALHGSDNTSNANSVEPVCAALDIIIPPVSCDPQVNLLKNGGFEAPALSLGTWDVFYTGEPTLEWITGENGIEIQNHVAGSPFAGEQHAELDPHNVTSIWQEIATEPGYTYRFSTQYSPRPGRTLEDVRFEFLLNGSTLGDSVARTGEGNSDTDWTFEERLFVATDVSTMVGFVETGLDTSYGAYLDEVGVFCEPNPPVINEKPVITLRGLDPVALYVGNPYTEEGADVDDAEDGEIDYKLVIAGDVVNTSIAGTYVVTYNATDTGNLAADEVTRTVKVSNPAPDPKQCEDGTDNDGDNLIDAADPGCHTDGDPDNINSYVPTDDDEFNEIPYGPYCGDGIVNQTWESCDGGDQCTAQCQLDNQCVEKAFARVNTDEVKNYSNGDASSDVFLGSSTNKIPGGAWFIIYDEGNYITDPFLVHYEDVPGLAVQRIAGKVRTLLHGSHGHDGSKEFVTGNVELFNVELVTILDDTSGNNKLENANNGIKDELPGEDEVWTLPGNTSQAFFWLTVTTADDGFYAKYGDDVPVCPLPNTPPSITIVGDNPLIVPLFGTYTDNGATATDAQDDDVTLTAAIVVGGDTVNPSVVGTYEVTYNVIDSGGLSAETATRTVSVVDLRDPAECSDGITNDNDSVFDETDPGCHTDGNPDNPASYDPNDDDENQMPVITLRGSSPINIVVGSGPYTELEADVDDYEDGDIDGNLVIAGDTVDTDTIGTYTITYNANDNEGASADEVTRIVNVVAYVPECSDGITNDNDLVFDETDPGCWTDPTDSGTYDPNDDSENEIPVITLRGDAVVDVMQGTSYTDSLADVDDAEDGDIDGNLVIAGDTVDTNTLGTYTITYNAQDSLGAPAVEVTRTVNVLEEVVTECSDQIDNDEDGLTDALDTGCWSDPSDPESYDPSDDSENNKPVITRIGSGDITIDRGTTYTDGGATADDAEDGNITGSLVTTGSVNTSTVGVYTIRYNVTDSDGLAADEVIRTVRVKNPTVTPVCTSNCGGGGGGPISTNLRIFNEKITVIGDGTALITWETNKPADSRVVYDDDSQTLSASVLNFGTGSENLGYGLTTNTSPALKLEHSMIVTNVNLEDLFYFRPLSSDGTRAIGIELSAVLGQVTGGTCEQLLFEFIRFGSNNNPVEVRKLQSFLNDFEGNNLVVNGIYDRATFDAVVAFQNKYSGDVLSPWGLQSDTGYVYLTTRKKINEIYCNFRLPFPLTGVQQAEVNAFKALLEQLEATGQPLPDTSNVGLVPTAPTFAEGVTPNTSLTEETTSEGGLAIDEDGVEGEENEDGDDSLAAAIEAVEGSGGGFFSRIGNFIKGIFR